MSFLSRLQARRRLSRDYDQILELARAIEDHARRLNDAGPAAAEEEPDVAAVLRSSRMLLDRAVEEQVRPERHAADEREPEPEPGRPKSEPGRPSPRSTV